VSNAPEQTRLARLARIELPEFGAPTTRPDFPPPLHAERLERLAMTVA